MASAKQKSPALRRAFFTLKIAFKDVPHDFYRVGVATNPGACRTRLGSRVFEYTCKPPPTSPPAPCPPKPTGLDRLKTKFGQPSPSPPPPSSCPSLVEGALHHARKSKLGWRIKSIRDETCILEIATDTVLQRIAEGHPNYLVELLNDTSFTFLMIDMSPGGDWGRFLGWFFHDLKGTTLKELHVLDLHICLQDYCSLGAFLSRCSALESLTLQAPVKYFKDRTDGDLWEALPRVHPFALLAHSIATQRPTVIRFRLPTLHYVTFLPHITKAFSESQVKHLDLEIPQLPAYFFDNLTLPHLISLTLRIFQPTDFTHLALFLARLPVLDVLRLSFDNYLENWEVTAGLSAFCRSRSFSRVRKLYLHHRFFDPEDGVMLDVDELLGALDSGSGYAGNLHSLHLGNPRERFLVEQESQALPYFLAQLKAPNLRHLSILELVIPLGFGERLAEVIARSPLVSLHVVLSDFDMRAISSQAERYFRGETQDADLTSVLSAIKGSTTLQDVSLYREASVRSHGPAFPGWNSCLHNRDRHRDEWDRLRSRNAALARRTQETAIKALPLARILLCSRPPKRRGRAWSHLPPEILQVIILHATDDPMALSLRQWSRLWRYATDRATISHAADIMRRVQQYDKPHLFDPHCGCGDVYGHAYSSPARTRVKASRCRGGWLSRMAGSRLTGGMRGKTVA